jgi:hypothetical protein
MMDSLFNKATKGLGATHQRIADAEQAAVTPRRVATPKPKAPVARPLPKPNAQAVAARAAAIAAASAADDAAIRERNAKKSLRSK